MPELQKNTPTLRSYNITIPHQEVSKAISAETQNQQNYRSQDELMNAAVYRLVQEHVKSIEQKDGFSLLGIKDITVQPEDEKSEPSEELAPLKFTVELECLPPVSTEEIKGKSCELYTFNPSEKEILDFAKEHLLQKAGSFEDHDPITEDCVVQCSVSCKVDNTVLPSYSSPKCIIDMRKKDFFPEILEKLAGQKSGTTLNAKAVLPASSSPLLHQKEADFHIEILAVKKFVPATQANDESAQKAGFKSWDDFFSSFQKEVVGTGQKTAQELSHKNIMSLIASMPFDIPGSLLSERLEHQTQSALKSIEPRKKLTEDEERFIKEAAEREAKIVTFVLSYAHIHQIEVSQKDVQAVHTPKTPEESEFYQGILLEGRVFEAVRKVLTTKEAALSLKDLIEKTGNIY